MERVPGWLRWVVGVAGAMLAPFALSAAYFSASGPAGVRNVNFDLPARALAVFAGAGCLAALPVRPDVRGILIVTYIPVFGPLVFLFSLLYVCAAFGDCL